MKSNMAITPQMQVSIQASDLSGTRGITGCVVGEGEVLVGLMAGSEGGDGVATDSVAADAVATTGDADVSWCVSSSTALAFPLSTLSALVPSSCASSSRYASLSSSGTSSSFLFPSVSSTSFTASSLSFMISRLLLLHPAQVHFPLSFAILSLASLLHSMPPS